MSGIPPNSSFIAGSIAQAQVSSAETAKTQNSQRNKRAQDARELEKLADKQQHEVEDTEETENLQTRRPGEGDSNRQNKQDQQENPGEDQGKLYNADGSINESSSGASDPSQSSDEQDGTDTGSQDHIDLSA